MAPIIRNVKEMAIDDRRRLEHVVGHDLRDDQSVVIQIVSGQIAPIGDAPPPNGGQLPAWCNVYDGLTTDEIAEVEAAALDRSHWVRPSA